MPRCHSTARTHRCPNRFRSGIAAVEFAVVLPPIVLLMLGAVELSRGVMIAHSLQEASQAACRVYSVEGTTQAEASAVANSALADSGITGFSIDYEPSSKSAVDTSLEPVTVTVSVPYANVAWIAPSFLASATLQGRCVMPADIDSSD